MQKWQVILTAALLCAGSVSGQPNKAASHEGDNAKKSNPTIVLTAPEQQNRGQENEATASTGTPKGNATIERPRWWGESDWWLVLIASLTAAVIGWQSFETRKAAKATEAAVRTAENAMKLQEDTAKRQLRAYICITESGVKLTADGRVEAQIHFKNGGQTPAYDVRSWSYPLVDPYPLTRPVEDPPEQLPMARGIIPAQEKQIMVAAALTLAPQIMERLSNKDFAFFVIGAVNYMDTFGERHVLRYRLVFGGPAGTRITKNAAGERFGSLCMDMDGNEEEQTTKNPN